MNSKIKVMTVDNDVNYNEDSIKIKKWKNEFYNSENEEWQNLYRNVRIINVKKHLDEHDIELLKKLQIAFENKLYTAYEYCTMKWFLLLYCEDKQATEEIKEIQKNLNDAGVTKEEYKKLLKKFEKIDNTYGVF